MKKRLSTRATKQHLCIITAGLQALYVLKEDYQFGSKDLTLNLDACLDRLIIALDSWPEKGCEPKHGRWAVKRSRKWLKGLNGLRDVGSITSLVYVVSEALSFVHDRTTSGEAKRLIDDAFPYLNELINFFDERGSRFSCLEQASGILSNLYDFVGVK